MRAKEYFEKYEQPMLKDSEEDILTAISDLMREMMRETNDILTKRGIKKPKAAVAVIKEQNDKWNSICNMFEKKYGSAPLLRDGFKNYWLKEMPELAPLM